MLGIRPFGAFANAGGAPVLASIVVPADGLSLVLTYDKSLDETSVPANTSFVLGATHAKVASGGVDVTGDVVTLTFPTGVRVHAFEAPTVSYTAGANPIRDAALNAAENLSAEAATNNSEFLDTAVAIVGVMRAGVFTESAGALTSITNEVSGVAWTVTGTVDYSATAFNSTKPGLSGWGTANYLTTTEAAVVAAGVDSAPCTIATLIEGTTAAFATIAGWQSSTIGNSRRRVFQTNSTGRLRFQTVDDSVASVSTVSIAAVSSDPHALQCIYSGSEVSMIVDNDAPDPDAAVHTIADSLTPNRFSIGVIADNSPDLPLDAATVVPMLCVFSTALGTTGITTRATVDAYLAALGGL